MAKKLFSMMVLALFVAVAATSCDKKKDEGSSEEPAKKEAAATAKEDEGGGGGGGGACEQYSKCCNDYVDALSKLENVPAASIDAAKKGCAQIDTIKGQPGADDACKAGLDAMRKAAGAFKGMGLEMPASCK